MVKTLKITTIAVAVFALAFIIFIAAKGIASDEGIEKFLSAQGVAEQLQAGSAGSTPSAGDQETPLIRQAKAFALRIDPPPPPQPVVPKGTPAQTEPTRRPQVDVSAKFTLVGTSYYTGDEENSWALINEVGKGWHWVKQGEKAGHLIVEKIGDGVVLIRDGSKTYELAAERTQKVDYVKSFTGTVSSGKTVPAWRSAEKAATNAESSQRTDVSSTENQPIVPELSPEEAKKQLEENAEWVRQLQENPESLGMTDEEAKELEGLGEMLKSLETEIEAIEPNEPNAADKSDLAEAEPNSTKNSNIAKTEDANEQNSSEIKESRRIRRDERDGQDEEVSRPSRRSRRPR